MEHKNRYNDKFTFTKDSEGNILWEGKFKWCRFAWPNDYTEAYNKYVTDDCDSSAVMTPGEFKKAVHETDEHGYTDFAMKYMQYVKSDTSKIHMVDPSGGPYLTEGSDMGYIADEFKGMIVKEFQSVDENTWKIIINDKTLNNQDSNETNI
jgi:hypothetical protein